MNSASVFLADLARNLRAGLRLAFFRRVEARSFIATVEQFVALILIDLVLTCLADVAAAGLDGRFNPWGLPGALFYLPLLMLAGYVVARREEDSGLVLRLPIAVLAAGQYITLGGMLLYGAADSGWLDISEPARYFAYHRGPYLWWLLSAAFAVVCLTQRTLHARLLHMATLALLLFLPLWFLPRASTGALWTARDDEQADARQEARYYAVSSEDALYAQPEILRRSLAELAPGRPGVEDLYFVGVAGYAAEDVFRKELSVVSTLFDQRFGTAGRSISLINNPGTVLQSPIASVTSLERTLARVGQLMNQEEDVLVLYLTSHGSEDHRFALEFWPLRLRDLSPQALRRMLDASGIKWRIIVVSACYSGGFIEPLKDQRTLIVTAADPRHQSFGCGAASDFTYFSKAYVDDALRASYSFTGAFDIARHTIEIRERAEGRTPSNPQMYVGPQMARKLRGLERRWNTGD
jgi:hypothetical protein